MIICVHQFVGKKVAGELYATDRRTAVLKDCADTCWLMWIWYVCALYRKCTPAGAHGQESRHSIRWLVAMSRELLAETHMWTLTKLMVARNEAAAVEDASESRRPKLD